MQRNFFRNTPERNDVRLRTLLILLVLAIFPTVLVADEHSITFDEHTDFAKLRTFAIRNSRCDSTRPELNNPLYLKKLADTIRAALAAKGLKETADRPDLYVDFRISGMEVSTADEPNRRLRGGDLYVEGTVTLDLVRREPSLLVWEGIFHDTEDNGSRLAQKFPADVKKLLSKYPPRK
jgi:hypothetical protein